MLILKSLTIVVVCFTIYARAVQIDTKWRKDSELYNLISRKCLLDTFHGITLVSCAVFCMRRDVCKSFFFTKSSKTCYHHATRFDTGGTVNSTGTINSTFFYPMPGTHYFYNVAQKDAVVSTPSHIKCAAAKCTGFTYLPEVDKFYKMTPYGNSNWENATEECFRVGGTLATPKDQATIDALEAMIHSTMRGFENLKGFWVSARLDEKLNKFIWLDDNSTVSSGLWHPGKPEYFTKPGSDTECVVLVPLYKFKLADFRCKVTVNSIIPLCECK